MAQISEGEGPDSLFILFWVMGETDEVAHTDGFAPRGHCRLTAGGGM